MMLRAHLLLSVLPLLLFFYTFVSYKVHITAWAGLVFSSLGGFLLIPDMVHLSLVVGLVGTRSEWLTSITSGSFFHRLNTYKLVYLYRYLHLKHSPQHTCIIQHMFDDDGLCKCGIYCTSVCPKERDPSSVTLPQVSSFSPEPFLKCFLMWSSQLYRQIFGFK